MRAPFFLAAFLFHACLLAQLGVPTAIDTTEIVAPFSVAALDTDGDGDLDLVAGGDELILLGNLGAGDFAPAIILAEGLSVARILNADLDQDGVQDLLILLGAFTGPSSLARMKGNGDGTFGAMDTILTPQEAYFERAIDLADVDQDGDLDILLCTGYEVVGLENDGEGMFSGTFNFPFDTPSGRAMRVVDINGDGWPDIIRAYPSTIAVHVGTGPATWAAATVLPFQYATTVMGIEVHDVNADGFLDIYCPASSNNRVVHALGSANGFGILGQMVGYPMVNSPSTVAFGNLNGIGQIEIVVGCSGNGRPGLIRTFAANGESVQAVVFDILDNIKQMLVIDLDQDGDLDIVSVSIGDNHVNWYPNDGEGGFPEARSLTSTVAPMETFLAEDLDGDGDRDIVANEVNRVVHYLNDGSGSFGEQRLQSHIQGGTAMKSVDLDGDGTKDLVCASNQTSTGDDIMFYRGLGDATFASGELIGTVGNYLNFVRSMDVADLDGDDDPDIVMTVTAGSSYSSWRLLWIENLGQSGYAQPALLFDTGVSGPFNVRAVDLSSDGLVDLLMSMDQSSRVMYFRNNGNGSWAEGQSVADYPNNSSLTFDVGDINGDGVNDVVTSGSTLDWRMFNADGSLGATHSVGSAVHPGPVHCVDLDGNGHLDLLVPGAVHFSSGDGFFAPAYSIAWEYPEGMMFAPPADLDGDGAADLLWTRGSIQSIPPSLRGKDLFSMRNLFQTPYSVQGSVFLDTDADGHRDAEEQGLPWVQLSTTPALYGILSGETGEYTANIPVGEYELACHPPSDLWEVTNDPETFSITVLPQQEAQIAQDFGLTPAVDTTMVIPTLTYSGGLCSGTASFQTSLANAGTREEEGVITLTLDDAFVFVSASPAPISVTGSSVSWTVQALAPFHVFNAQVVVEVPGIASMGDTLRSSLQFTGVDNGEVDAEQAFVLTCSYDPNDKQVSPAGFGPYGAVDIDTGHLDYTIRFQNTGNANATNVVLKDQLPSSIDRSRIGVLGFSHRPTSIQVSPAGLLTVRFDGIMLPDSAAAPAESQGSITLRMGLRPGLLNLTAIHNNVAIHFDLNPPIITNTAVTTLVDCDLWDVTITSITPDVLMASSGSTYQWSMNGELLAEDTLQTLLVGSDGDYSVAVTSAYGCIATAEFQVIGTGIDDRTSAHVAVVPNPFGQEARLIVSEVLTAQHVIELIDVHGRTVQAFAGTGTREVILDRSGMASGLYLVRILKDEQLLGMVRVVVE